MKKLINLLAVAAFIAFGTSCKSEKEDVNALEGKNMVSFEFDAGFGDEDLVLGTEYSINGEKIKISAFDYIVGNFVLVKEDGKEEVYPKEKSFFVLSEGGKKTDANTKEKVDIAKQAKVMLADIPAGKYTKIKFGLGIDEETYKKGDQFAGKLWERAEKYGLTWSWASGYKFTVLEGMVNYVETDSVFRYHVAAAANKDHYKAGKELYKEVTLTLDEPILVSKDKSPQLHVKVDVSKLLKGKNTIKVSEKRVLMGPKAAPIAENSMEIFMVHHVHYGAHKH